MMHKALSQQERFDWLCLSRAEQVGPITFYKLLERYGSAANALDMLPELSKRGGRKKPLKAQDRRIIEEEMVALDKMGATFIAACEPAYPEYLAACEDAPPVIAVLGQTQLLQKPGIAMVGARNASLNGRKLAEKIARELGDAGYTVVSGLARGIDAAAHVGSLNTGTVAVVAGGLDVIYPQENTPLFHEIKDRGCVVAESALGTQPKAQHFPRRNRIVSGLTLGTVVIEASPRSGSLITARLAGEQGREVFAVPGSPLDPRAQGTNGLIKSGATLVENARDIIEALETLNHIPLSESPQQGFFTASAHMAETDEIPDSARADLVNVILEMLSPAPIEVDEIIRACHVSTPVVLTVLLELELAGRLQRQPGNRVTLIEQDTEEVLNSHVG